LLEKKLNIVSFDVPFPPNYGGVIDVFFKLKALHEIGVKIYLHNFEYGRGKQPELEKYCEKVWYYKRNNFYKSLFSITPYIVKSRANEELIKNLNTNLAPILFEGLHTTFPLINTDFLNRKILIRAHNIEHNYYKGLSKSESHQAKKVFFKTEAKKLKSFEPIIKKATYVLGITPFENEYFLKKYHNAVYIPAFHQNSRIKALSPKGKFAFYHGDLRVIDNIKAALFLIDIFKNLEERLVIASSFPNKEISAEINKYNTIEFILLKGNKQFIELLNEAHINVLPTFQKTGIKLKLINTLFNGRHCLVSPKMVEDTGLDKLCEIALNKAEFIQKIKWLSNQEYSVTQQNSRKFLEVEFNNIENAKKIKDLL